MEGGVRIRSGAMVQRGRGGCPPRRISPRSTFSLFAVSAARSLIISLVAAGCLFPRTASADEVVVLLHGIANVPLSMKYLENRIEDAGYRVLNLGYPSTKVPIEEAARSVREKIREAAGDATISFVGHSMGNLVIRTMLREKFPNLGRIVMIAPPNQGSLMAQQVEDLDLYQWIFGPAGRELPADNKAFFESLPIPPTEFGIIAGGRGDGEGFNPLLEGDDDSTVRVEETRLPGAADFVLIHNTHTLLLFDPETARQAIHFLKTGRFEKGKAGEEVQSLESSF